MGQYPGADEELQLTPSFGGIGCVYVDDAAGIVAGPVRNAAARRERRDELVEQVRLADADCESHPTDYSISPARWIQTTV